MPQLPLTPAHVRPPTAARKPCGKVAPQPHPPAGVPIEGNPRWDSWEPVRCDRDKGHEGDHWAGLLHWA